MKHSLHFFLRMIGLRYLKKHFNDASVQSFKAQSQHTLFQAAVIYIKR